MPWTRNGRGGRRQRVDATPSSCSCRCCCAVHPMQVRGARGGRPCRPCCCCCRRRLRNRRGRVGRRAKGRTRSRDIARSHGTRCATYQRWIDGGTGRRVVVVVVVLALARGPPFIVWAQRAGRRRRRRRDSPGRVARSFISSASEVEVVHPDAAAAVGVVVFLVVLAAAICRRAVTAAVARGRSRTRQARGEVKLRLGLNTRDDSAELSAVRLKSPVLPCSLDSEQQLLLSCVLLFLLRRSSARTGYRQRGRKELEL